MNQKFLALLFAFAFFCAGVSAVTTTEQVNDIVVNRAFIGKAAFGEKIWVAILVENNSVESKSIVLVESLGNADFNKTNSVSVDLNHGTFWNYNWALDIAANGRETIVYWLMPKEVGSYVIPSMQVKFGGETFYLAPREIMVNCIADSKCDASIGETYLNCPMDCLTGASDGGCDFMKDNVCDPDCEAGFDPDCGASDSEVAANIGADSNVLTQSGEGTAPDYFLPVILIVLVLVAAGIVFFLKKQK